MKTSVTRIPVLLLAGLPCVAAVATPASAQTSQIPLSGLTSSQASVGSAINTLCPQLRPSNAAQLDLSIQCGNMVNALLGTGLPNALSNVTTEQTTTQGTGVVETRSPQFRSVGVRLASLRLGGVGGLNVGDLKLDLDGKTATAAPLRPDERVGGASADASLGGRLGVFLNAIGSFGNKSTTDNEPAYDFHSIGTTAGADYRFSENIVAGLALSYLRTDQDITSFALGEVNSNSYGLALYGTYYLGPFYVDLLGGFAYYTFDTTRRIVYGSAPDPNPALAVDRTATSDTHGWQYMFNGGAGYDFHQGAFTATPYARMDFFHLQVSGFAENGADGLNLKVHNQTTESLLSVLGTRLSYAFSMPFGVLVPQIRGEWRHEFLNDQRSIRAQFINDPSNTVFAVATDNPDRNYFAVGAGISAVLQKGVAVFFDYETVLGLQSVTNHGFTAGLRISF